MAVKIEFTTGNDAFHGDNLEYETARILNDVAHKILSGYLKDNIRDVNGNRIGEFEVD